MASFGAGRLDAQCPVTLKGAADILFLKELIDGQSLQPGQVGYKPGSEKHHIFDEGDPVFRIRGSGLVNGASQMFVSVNGMRLINNNLEETEDAIQFVGINLNNWSPTKESYRDQNKLGWNASAGEELMLPLGDVVNAGDTIVWYLPDPTDADFKQQIKKGFPIERLTPQFRPLDWRESQYIVEGMVLDMLNPEGLKKMSIPDHANANGMVGLKNRETAAFHARSSTLMTVMRGIEVLLQRRVIDIVTQEQEELKKLDDEIATLTETLLGGTDVSTQLTQIINRRKALKSSINNAENNVFKRTSFGGRNPNDLDERLTDAFTLYDWKYQDPRNPATTKEEVIGQLNANRNKVFWLANVLGLMGVSDRNKPSNAVIDDIIKTVYVSCLSPNEADQYLSLFPDSESIIGDPVTRVHVGQYLALAVNHAKQERVSFAVALDHIKRKIIGVATGNNNNTSELMTKTGVIYHP